MRKDFDDDNDQANQYMSMIFTSPERKRELFIAVMIACHVKKGSPLPPVLLEMKSNK